MKLATRAMRHCLAASAFGLASLAGTAELEDNLLASSVARLDIKGVEIALKNGANTKEKLKHPDAPTVLVTPIQLALRELDNREDKRAAEKVAQILHLLFSKGARLTGARDELFPAIAYGHYSILKMLLENGANPHIRIYGYLPTELAVKYEQEQLLPLLFARGAAKVAPEDVAQIQLIRAATRQSKEAMQAAVLKGALINQPDMAGSYAIVQLLV